MESKCFIKVLYKFRVFLKCFTKRYSNETFCYNTAMTFRWWRLLSQLPPIRYFPYFSVLPKHTLARNMTFICYRCCHSFAVVTPFQIWMWFKECDSYFCKIEHFVYGEINERGPLVTPTCHRPSYHMINSRHRNTCGITGSLWGESTCPRQAPPPPQKVSNAEWAVIFFFF